MIIVGSFVRKNVSEFKIQGSHAYPLGATFFKFPVKKYLNLSFYTN